LSRGRREAWCRPGFREYHGPATVAMGAEQRRTAWAVAKRPGETSPPFQRRDQGPRAVGVAKRQHEHCQPATGGRLPAGRRRYMPAAGRRCGNFQGRRRVRAEFIQLPANVRFQVDLPAVTADERRGVLKQCQRVRPPAFGCHAACFDLAPTEIAFREQLAASLRQQAVPQGPGVPADPPAARTSRLSAGNLGLNSTGTLQGFRHSSGKPTIRPSACQQIRCNACLRLVSPSYCVPIGVVAFSFGKPG
jgi:hypothetical protein